VLNLCSILKPKKFENNLIRFKSTLSKTLAKSKNGDDLLALYPSMFPGVANSTSVLFNQSIALPSYGVLEMIGLHNKAIEQVAKVILKSPIKKLVISGGSIVLFQLIEVLHAKKGKQVLDIYFLWHGSSAQWSDPHHMEQFNITRNLYNQKKIQGIITLKKDLEHVLQAYGIKNYLLQNFVEQQHQNVIATPKTNKFRIGIWSAYANWIKNLHPQIIATKILKDDLILSSNFNFSKEDSWIIEDLETKRFEQKLPHDQLMLAMANTDITLYVTNSECSPMIAQESLSLGIPCIVGPTSALYDGNEFLKEILTVNRVDCPIAISRSIQKTMQYYDKIKAELPKFVAKYNAEASLLKQDFYDKVKIEEERIFSEIYDTNFWTNGSGPGSHKNNTIEYREILQEYFDDKRFKTYTDLGCGDWQIMKLINIPDNKIYKGYDIAKTVIDTNNLDYKKENISFYHINNIDLIESADLLIIKDVMIHWTNERVLYFINNILPKFKYAIFTEDYCTDSNILNADINFGQFRCIDITQPTFNSKSCKVISEYKTNSWNKRVYLYTNPVDPTE
jgi:hypothetical protein